MYKNEDKSEEELYQYLFQKLKDKSLQKTDHLYAYSNWFSKVPKDIREVWENCIKRLALAQGGFQKFECYLWTNPLLEELFKIVNIAKKLKEKPKTQLNNEINEKLMKQFIQAYNEIKPESINEKDWFHQCTPFLLRRYGEFMLYKSYITKLRQGTLEKIENQEYSCSKRFSVLEYKGTIFNLPVDIKKNDPIFLNFSHFLLIENNDYVSNVSITTSEFINMLVISACANFLENCQQRELRKDFYSIFLYNILEYEKKLKDKERLKIIKIFKEALLKSLDTRNIIIQISNVIKKIPKKQQQQ